MNREMRGKSLHLNALHRTDTNQFWDLKGAKYKRQKQSSVPDFFQENCSKLESAVLGPGGGAGIGCGVGVGLGLVGDLFDAIYIVFFVICLVIFELFGDSSAKNRALLLKQHLAVC
nr:keratin-3, type I cytoskeletal 51 kDa isoform X1 [Ipomoea batatas]